MNQTEQALTAEEREALSEAVARADVMAEALGISFEEAARTVARGSALFEESVAAMVALHNEPTTTGVGEREHAEKQIDRLIPEIATTMEEWLGRDRENWRSSNRAAGRLQLLMRSVSGYAGDIAAIDSREHWWGVNAQRDD